MNKKIIRGVCIAVGLTVVIGIVIVAANIAFLFLIARSHPRVITATGPQVPGANGLPPGLIASGPPPQTRINLPAAIVDSQNYGTENNWLAHHIALRIAALSYLVLHPNSSTLPDFKIKARVDADAHTVHLEIENFSASPVLADLKPDFAWDPDGYAPLAAQLLGGGLSPAEVKDDASSDLLTELLTLTGPELAKADMRLSAQMQQTPSSPGLHEQAALILVGLALRDRASIYTDYRQILCRATAHLALAEALRHGQAATWAGGIADAGVRTLSGRETDALVHLDARTDAPPAAKSWIAALRLRTKGDWRSVPVDANSPLLLKIVWAHVLADELTDLGAAKQLNALGNLENVPDWGRCALTNWSGHSVESGNTYAEQTALLEFQELAQILQIEQAPAIDPKNLKAIFASSLQEKVFDGQPATLHIVGPEMFCDVTRRHLFSTIRITSDWLANLLGVKDEAKAYATATRQAFAGTRLFETVYFSKNPREPMNYPGKLMRLDQENIRWEPWELAMSKLPDCPDLIYPDFHTLHAFYADGLPFGTAYDLDDRKLFSLNNARLLADDAHPEVFHDPNPDVAHPDGDSLRKLAPDSFTALLIGTKVPDVIQRSKPWWDFNLQPIMWIENSTRGFISEEDHAVLMQKHVLLHPDQYFALGIELRRKGKIDEAAVADRKGFEQAFDHVLMSDSIDPLVDYYYDHGRKDEAEMVAKGAAEVGSQSGLLTYERLLQKLGRLDEAEQLAQAIKDSYDDPMELAALYAAHPEHFGDKSIQASREAFPKGMTKVDLSNFQGTPAKGCVFTTDSDLLRQGGLQPGDIVVALDSYKIESMAQYNYVRALSTDPRMHLIIWRNGHYLPMSTSAPNRLFQVTLDDYPPKPKE